MEEALPLRHAIDSHEALDEMGAFIDGINSGAFNVISSSVHGKNEFSNSEPTGGQIRTLKVKVSNHDSGMHEPMPPYIENDRAFALDEMGKLIKKIKDGEFKVVEFTKITDPEILTINLTVSNRAFL